MFVDTGGASAIYEISKSTLTKWRLRGYGPPFAKLGSAVRYDTDKFDAWVEAQTRRSTSETPPKPAPTPPSPKPPARRKPKGAKPLQATPPSP